MHLSIGVEGMGGEKQSSIWAKILSKLDGLNGISWCYV